jgi:glycosyltransferase involved in cell wall biosynthesis
LHAVVPYPHLHLLDLPANLQYFTVVTCIVAGGKNYGTLKANLIPRSEEGWLIASRGHEVLVVTASDRQRAYTDSTAGLKLARLRSFPNPVRVDQRFLLWPRREIAAELQAFHPDVLHLHDPLLDIPVVLTVHALPCLVSAYAPALPGLRQGIEAGLWTYANWLRRQCEAVITPSRVIADIVSAHANCRPQVISNGVDLKRFTPCPASLGEGEALRQKYSLDPHLPIILYAGRIDVDKRVDLVVRAAAQAMHTVDAQLLVVGDGRRRAAVIRLSEELGIRHLSHFPGFVPATGDLPGLYRLASVFITASEIETQSLVVLEAAATGLPVVSVRTAAAPEVMEDGVNGYLVAPRDIDAMADRLVLLLRDPVQARAMGQAGRAMVERHSLDRSIEAHEELYRSLVLQ